MISTYTEQSLAASMACLKWSQKIPCFSCGAFEFYYLKDYSRKCTSCKTRESVTAHTAFHRQNLKIDIAVDILLSIQHRMYDGPYPFLSPVAHVANEFRLSQPTVYKFLKRLHNWLPDHYHQEPAEELFGLLYNSVRNPAVYYSLYRLLFDEEHSKRPLEDIVSLLTIKAIQPIEQTRFYQFLHETKIASFQLDKKGFYKKGNQLKNKRVYLEDNRTRDSAPTESTQR